MALQQYRQEGNKLFNLKKYEEAIKQYTKAIVSLYIRKLIIYFKLFIRLFNIFKIFQIFQNKGASSSIFFSNRALCYLKLKQWEKVCL